LAPIHGLDTRPTSLLRILAGKTAGKNQAPTKAFFSSTGVRTLNFSLKVQN